MASFGQISQPNNGHRHAFLGDIVQVPTAARLDQLLLADPDLKLVGPYDGGDPDVQPVVTRGLVIVPKEYALPFLTTGMQPMEAYQVLWGLLVQKGAQSRL